jgi:alkylation response protein AidB-like acyl-CoA dehydrogenase
MAEMDWLETARTLGADFATRAAAHDADDSFVAENYAALKAKGFFPLGVPSELGGGGASHAELCAVIRELGRHCSSTALAASMHTHLVATLAYIWRSGNKAPEGMLRRVASEGLVLVSTGGSDWLPGSGKLEKVEGGYRITGRKIFGSGVPAGDVLLTTGVYDDPKDGPTVIHFPVSLKADGVKVLDTWRVLGMRATGSQDIQLDSVFVPDAAMGGVHRPAGRWHPFMHTVCLVALPVFYSAYLGVVDAARQAAIDMARRKREDRVARRDGKPRRHRADRPREHGGARHHRQAWSGNDGGGGESADDLRERRSARGGKGHGGRGGCRLLSQRTPRAAVSRHPGRPLSPASGEAADALYGTSPPGARHRRMR